MKKVLICLFILIICFSLKSITFGYAETFINDELSNNCSTENFNGSQIKDYDGVDEDGVIYDLDEYVYSRYNYRMSILNTTSNDLVNISKYNFTTQMDTSVYILSNTDYDYSEGNCVIHSVYSLMKYWADCKHTTLNNSINFDQRKFCINFNSSVEIEREKSYAEYAASVNKTIKRNLEPISNLYLQLREGAYNNGYLPQSGMNIKSLTSTIQSISNKISMHASLNINNDYTFNNVISEINSDRPIFYSVNNDVTYGYHALTIIGYKYYTLNNQKIGFYKVGDNHSNTFKWVESNETLDFYNTSRYSYSYIMTMNIYDKGGRSINV